MEKSQVSKRSMILIIVLISSFLTPFMGSALNVAMPAIGKELGLSATMLSWVATSYLLGSAIFLVPFGVLADLYGRRLFFMIGMAIFTITSFLTAFSTAAWMIISFRIIQGIGGSMAFATAMPILISVYPQNERGKVIGLSTAMVYIGLSVGPFVGGILTANFGWPSVFWATVPLSFCAFFLAFLKMEREELLARSRKMDFYGSLLYGLTLLTIMYGFSTVRDFWGIILLSCGIVLLFVFIKVELRLNQPLLDIRLFRDNRVFAFSNLAALINYSATFAVSFLISLYLQQIRGLSPQAAGLVLISQPILQAIFSPLAGKLSDRVEPQLIASVGMGITTIGLGGLFFLTADSSNWFIVPILALLGFSFALFSSPNTNAVMSSVDKTLFGTATGTLGTMRITGQTLSMGIASLVMSLYFGKLFLADVPPDLFMQSLKICFIIFAVLCLFGTVASLARGNVR